MLSRTHAAGSNGSKQFDCDPLTYPGSRSLSLIKDFGSRCSSAFHILRRHFLLHPLPNLPFHDDWTYAWSVEHFLNTGELQVLDWSVHYPFVQILWGALFCLPFGFSFFCSSSFHSCARVGWGRGLIWYDARVGTGSQRESYCDCCPCCQSCVFCPGLLLHDGCPVCQLRQRGIFLHHPGTFPEKPFSNLSRMHFCGVCPLHKTNSRCDTSQPTALFSFYAISQVVEISFTHQWNLFTVLPCPYFNCSNLWCDIRV